MCYDNVKVETIGAKEVENGKKLRILLIALVELSKRPDLTEDGFILIPNELRKEAEKAIEIAANLIAVSEMCKRSISSPKPFVAFIPADDDELAWLERTKGILSSLPISGNVRFSIENLIRRTNLTDRLDGVALLAEAFAQEHVSGRFHELLRVFERAFTLSSSALIEPLAQFLNSKGYTLDEIKKWVVDLRHRATHADRRDDFVLESDIRPIIYRMEVAAYDVLFNKVEWHSPSVDRREIFSPPATWDQFSGTLSIVQGANPTIKFQILDDFGAYPADLEGVLDLPSGWWSKTVDREDFPSASIE